MRQLVVHVPRGRGARVLDAARNRNGQNLSLAEGVDADGNDIDIVLVHVVNDRVGPLLEELEDVPDLRVSMIPTDAHTLYPPAGEVPDEVQDTTPRSAFEIYIAGVQSIGGWSGFLGFGVAAGVLVWLGLASDTVFLLIGAMLIAPFASPAMNAAVATARGDARLLWRSLLRYAVALAVTVAVAAALTVAFQHTTTTDLMLASVKVSIGALLLPVAAGGAGALHLAQSERSSLVSGAGSGMLIAASLAPPAGLVGMALVIGSHELLPAALFQLALQLVGINIAATVVFRIFDLDTSGPRFGSGKRWVTVLGIAGSVAGAAALLAWQFLSPPAVLQRATAESRQQAAVVQAVQDAPGIAPVEVNTRFVREREGARNTLLVTVYVRREPAGSGEADAEIRERLTDAIGRAIAREDSTVTGLVNITVVTRATPP